MSRTYNKSAFDAKKTQTGKVDPSESEMAKFAVVRDKKKSV